ncbi:MAG: Endopolyphosphatase [Thelocarpon superellum]|nr:MAG: Endopolyphosphatase [Thelocarpon superellum]
MHLLVSWSLSAFLLSYTLAQGQAQQLLGPVASPEAQNRGPAASKRALKGKFLHITDPHPDSHYQLYSSTKSQDACHRGSGSAGFYGAETSSCDSPFSLINGTFQWIDQNLKDEVDFVIFTGDATRHDSDEKIPRTQKEILDLNGYFVQKLLDVFGKGDRVNDTDPGNALQVPIIPSIGNNDIMPHNVMEGGPSFWTKSFANLWRDFIPEEQRHGFERGGWFFVEVIPNRLAVFSLNTMYFYTKNAAVDGCDDPSEPGYLHMEWLRIQLQFLRDRGMKAILTGHVPPSRTESKQSWDETCWQKYALWQQQYRDVISGAVYGHMNVDHFMLQDHNEIDITATADKGGRAMSGGDLATRSTARYLTDLRRGWAKIPVPPSASDNESVSENEGEETGEDGEDEVPQYGDIDVEKKKKKKKKKKKRKGKKDKYLEDIGGPWGERYDVVHVSPSIIPDFFPTLRVFEYNITGLEEVELDPSLVIQAPADMDKILGLADEGSFDPESPWTTSRRKRQTTGDKKKKKKKKKNKLIVPSPPSSSAPPGPAYSPQSLTLTGYTQYYANLTYLNHDLTLGATAPGSSNVKLNLQDERWQEGKKQGRPPLGPLAKAHPKPLEYQVEYSTINDTVYQLADLTVNSYLSLARRIGSSGEQTLSGTANATGGNDTMATASERRLRTRGKHEKRKCNEAWHTFLKRAFVGAVDDDEIEKDYGSEGFC